MPLACATPGTPDAGGIAPTTVAASREVLACRRSVAANPEYRPIAAHMPLIEFDRATVVQMGNPSLSTDEDIAALTASSEDIQQCRRKLQETVPRDIPATFAISIAGWNDNDTTLSPLVKRKLTWGAAATRLRTAEAELARRVAIFNALTGMVS